MLLQHINKFCNLSISKSSFPEDCKIAKIIPLYKKGSRTNPKNYRPISLLPIMSKIFERVAHNQTEEFLERNNLLYKYQSGFRKNHSTETCLNFLQDKISQGFDNGLHSGMILIDLQKAFDTINHEILFQKMEILGFSRQVIYWYRSYLVNRKFKVKIDKFYSEKGISNCGVPQGSILGPLLFLIYVNDMSQAVKCDLFLYADDSCLLFQDKVVKNIQNILSENFSNLCDWFVDNKIKYSLWRR